MRLLGSTGIPLLLVVGFSLLGMVKLSHSLGIQPVIAVRAGATNSGLPETSFRQLVYDRSLKVPVLLYHYIGISPDPNDVTRIGLSTSPIIFEQQLKLLTENGFTTITFDELAAGLTGKQSLPSKPVILTFDDGYLDFYTNAYPVLQKYQLKGTVFVVTSFIGRAGFMKWQQIEEIARSSYVTIGAHSVHHYALTKVSETTLINELTQSKIDFVANIGYQINWLAYPYGEVNNEVATASRRAGYVGAVTTEPGVWQYENRLFYVARLRVGNKLGNDLLRLLD